MQKSLQNYYNIYEYQFFDCSLLQLFILENSIMIEDIHNAIISLINSLYVRNQSPMENISELSDGVIFAEILCFVDQFGLNKQKIYSKKQNWTSALKNLKYIMECIESYYQNYLNKELQHHDLELIDISKNKNEEQIVKFFEIVLGVIIQSSNKDFFISKILTLDQQYQSYFVTMIQKVLGQSVNNEQINQQQENALLEKMDQLQSENQKLKNQIVVLIQQNQGFTNLIKELERKVELYSIQFQKLKNIKEEETHSEAVSPTETDNTNLNLIETLKQKLIQLSMDHEKQILKYQQQITLMENQIYKINELESLVDMYKENYQEALQHLNKINIWEKQREKLNNIIHQNQISMLKLEQLNESLQQKVNQQQEQIVELQMEFQRVNVRYRDLESNLRNRLSIIEQPTQKIRIGRATLASICPQIDNQSYKFKFQENVKELDKKNKKIRDLQKENKRLKEKTVKMNQLQKDKSLLQNAIIECNQIHSEEIELLTTCLYELRIKYSSLKQPLIIRNQRNLKSSLRG